jgi:hypothetical protein
MRQPKHTTDEFERPGFVYQLALAALAVLTVAYGILPGTLTSMMQ